MRVEKLSPKEERADGDCPDDALVDFDFFGEGESAALDAEKKKEQVGGGKKWNGVQFPSFWIRV